MVLNQNKYTMTSLGFNYQKPPLFLPNQTHPPSFLYIFQPNPPPPSMTLLSSSPPSLAFPAATGAAAPPPSQIHHLSLLSFILITVIPFPLSSYPTSSVPLLPSESGELLQRRTTADSGGARWDYVLLFFKLLLASNFILSLSFLLLLFCLGQPP